MTAELVIYGQRHADEHRDWTGDPPTDRETWRLNWETENDAEAW
jgi:hypothetical protein